MRSLNPQQQPKGSLPITEQQARAERTLYFIQSLSRSIEKQEALKRRTQQLEFRIDFIVEVIRKTKKDWRVL